MFSPFHIHTELKIDAEFRQLKQKSLLQRYLREDGLLGLVKRSPEAILRENYQESPLYADQVPVIGEAALQKAAQDLNTPSTLANAIALPSPSSVSEAGISLESQKSVSDSESVLRREERTGNIIHHTEALTRKDKEQTSPNLKPTGAEVTTKKNRRKGALPPGWSDVLPTGYVHQTSQSPTQSLRTTPIGSFAPSSIILEDESDLNIDSLPPPPPIPEGLFELETQENKLFNMPFPTQRSRSVACFGGSSAKTTPLTTSTIESGVENPHLAQSKFQNPASSLVENENDVPPLPPPPPVDQTDSTEEYDLPPLPPPPLFD